MAKIDIYTSEISAMGEQIKSASAQIKDAASAANAVKADIGMDVSAKADIEGMISNAVTSLNQQSEIVSALGNLVVTAAEDFRNADHSAAAGAETMVPVAEHIGTVQAINSMSTVGNVGRAAIAVTAFSTAIAAVVNGMKTVSQKLKAVWPIAKNPGIADTATEVSKTGNSSGGNDSASKDGAVAGAAAAGAAAGAAASSTAGKTNASTSGGKTTSSSTGKTTSTTKTTSTQKVSDSSILKSINSTYSNLSNNKKGKGFKGRCGALVYQQLNAAGVVKSGESTAYGKDYASVLAKKKKTKTGYTTKGYGNGLDAFNKMLEANKNKMPITNVVLSYKSGSITSSSAGHTMLISRIENGKVYFIDNTKACQSGKYIDGDKSKPIYEAQCWSLDKFKKTYFKSGCNSSGVTHLYK